MTQTPQLSVEGVSIVDGGAAVQIRWSNGETARFHGFWLRDNAQDTRTRDPGSGQRLLSMADLDTGALLTQVKRDGETLFFELNDDGPPLRFDSNWLLARRYDRSRTNRTGWVDERVTLWGSDTREAVPKAPFARLAQDKQALLSWLKAFRANGVALSESGPPRRGAVEEIVSWFGFVKETNYGRTFDVRSVAEPTNLAFSNQGLLPHTDNPYRDPQPTLQLLYCIENSADGGDSIVVDGFQVATTLRDEDPDAFRVLTRFCARFEYFGSHDVHLNSRAPLIELTADGELRAVRMNNRSAAATLDVPFDAMTEYYRAYAKFESMLSEPRFAQTFSLAPGDCFMVDNTRVLHSRTGFASGGSRWLEGCYADRDGLYSKLAVLEKEVA